MKQMEDYSKAVAFTKLFEKFLTQKQTEKLLGMLKEPNAVVPLAMTILKLDKIYISLIYECLGKSVSILIGPNGEIDKNPKAKKVWVEFEKGLRRCPEHENLPPS